MWHCCPERYDKFAVDICFSFGDILEFRVGGDRFGPPTGRALSRPRRDTDTPHGSFKGVEGLKTNETYHSKADALLIPEMFFFVKIYLRPFLEMFVL